MLFFVTSLSNACLLEWEHSTVDCQAFGLHLCGGHAESCHRGGHHYHHGESLTTFRLTLQKSSKTFCLFFFFLSKTEWLLWSDGDRETQAQCSWDHDRESWCVGWRRWVFNSKKILRIQCFLSLISSAFPGNKKITFLLTERFRSYTCYFDSTEGGRRTIMWNECGAGRYMRVNVLCQLCVQCYP